MWDYQEKRDYPRMPIDCPASFQIVGGMGGGALVKNLSGGGLLMWIDHDIAPGAPLRMQLKPVSDITPPMTADVEVLRCTPVDGADGGFAVACQIRRILG
jgi:hypothetical protein